MKRLYYTCDLKAEYMRKYFGVQVAIMAYFEYGGTAAKLADKHYISEESHDVFEPKHGDRNQDGDMFNQDIMGSDPRGAWEEIGMNDSHLHDDRFDQIIYREGKHFFMPEVEEVKNEG